MATRISQFFRDSIASGSLPPPRWRVQKSSTGSAGPSSLAVLQSVIDPSFHVTETVADQECKSQLAVCAKPGCGDGGARPPGRSQDDRQGEISVLETLLTTRTNRRAWRGSVLFLAILLVAVAANADRK